MSSCDAKLREIYWKALFRQATGKKAIYILQGLLEHPRQEFSSLYGCHSQICIGHAIVADILITLAQIKLERHHCGFMSE